MLYLLITIASATPMIWVAFITAPSRIAHGERNRRR
jgi:hypothetical protein